MGDRDGRSPDSLANATVGSRVCITSARLDEDMCSWLAAVGLHVGEEVIVLRRAAFGGPLHVRTSSGGEFAVAREVASCLQVTAATEGSR
ncbi:MAG TPA: FeoA family protein [Labilithrix sp.]|nr:FeoA family protein [Labilithrix sp.]